MLNIDYQSALRQMGETTSVPEMLKGYAIGLSASDNLMKGIQQNEQNNADKAATMSLYNIMAKPNPTVDDFKQMYALHPEMSDNILKKMSALSQEVQDQHFNNGISVVSALDNWKEGQPDIGVDLLKKQLDALKKAGNEAQVQSVTALISGLSDPLTRTQTLNSYKGALYAANPDRMSKYLSNRVNQQKANTDEQEALNKLERDRKMATATPVVVQATGPDGMKISQLVYKDGKGNIIDTAGSTYPSAGYYGDKAAASANATNQSAANYAQTKSISEEEGKNIAKNYNEAVTNLPVIDNQEALLDEYEKELKGEGIDPNGAFGLDFFGTQPLDTLVTKYANDPKAQRLKTLAEQMTHAITSTWSSVLTDKDFESARTGLGLGLNVSREAQLKNIATARAAFARARKKYEGYTQAYNNARNRTEAVNSQDVPQDGYYHGPTGRRVIGIDPKTKKKVYEDADGKRWISK